MSVGNSVHTGLSQTNMKLHIEDIIDYFQNVALYAGKNPHWTPDDVDENGNVVASLEPYYKMGCGKFSRASVTVSNGNGVVISIHANGGGGGTHYKGKGKTFDEAISNLFSSYEKRVREYGVCLVPPAIESCRCRVQNKDK